MSRESTILAISLASCLVAGCVESYQRLALDADSETIIRSLILFRSWRA